MISYVAQVFSANPMGPENPLKALPDSNQFQLVALRLYSLTLEGEKKTSERRRSRRGGEEVPDVLKELVREG